MVAPDVGACDELVNGRTLEDKALGPSGLITHVADPPSTADAIERIMVDDDLRRAMIQAGQERVRRYYQEEDLNREYHYLYQHYIGREAAA